MSIKEKLHISTKDLSKTVKSSRCVVLMAVTTISFIVLMLSTSMAERAKHAAPTSVLSYMCTFYMMNNCYTLMVLLISQEGKNVFPMRFLSLLHISGIFIAVLQIISLMVVTFPDAELTKSTGPTFTTGFFCLCQIFAAGAYLAAEFKVRDKAKNPSKSESAGDTSKEQALKGQGPIEVMKTRRSFPEDVELRSVTTSTLIERI